MSQPLFCCWDTRHTQLKGGEVSCGSVSLHGQLILGQKHGRQKAAHIRRWEGNVLFQLLPTGIPSSGQAPPPHQTSHADSSVDWFPEEETTNIIRSASESTTSEHMNILGDNLGLHPDPKIPMETQKTKSNQSSAKPKAWRHHNIQFKIILQSYRHKNSMSQKRTYQPMEQNGGYRKKPLQL